MIPKTKVAVLYLVLFSISGFAAELALPTIFSDHMVLQRDRAVPVWGTTDPGATVSVQFAGQKKTTKAASDGKWRVDLNALTASSNPRKMTVSCSNHPSIQFSDVLVGEVWLCSGQSNMEWSMARSENADAAIAAATHPEIRLYRTPKVFSERPMDTIDAQWESCSPETAKDFSAVAYYFGRKLQQDLKVPIGLLQSAWGGTRIEPWTPPCGFEGIDSLSDIHLQVQKTLPSSPLYKKEMKAYLARMKKWSEDTQPAIEAEDYVAASPAFPTDLILSGNQQVPTKLYNGMLHAHVPFAIRGAIWYQGESNHKEGMLYLDKTEAMLKGWRSLWGYDFPFYFVQIAPYQYGKEASDMLPIFWEAESEIVKTIPKTGMAVVSDYTTLNNIHPPNKEIPGTRLALLAEANDYGMDVVSTGPVFQSLEKQGGSLKLVFDSATGLTTRDGKAPDWFEVTGEDGRFKEATAKISGNAVIVHSDEVEEPVAVRFAWHKLATPNLVNAAGLPTAAFRAGDLPQPPNPAIGQVPEAEGFRMVYQLDVPAEANYSTEAPAYAVDSTSTDTAAFSKIAYYLELEKADGTKQFAFASMDRFTEDLKKTGLPVKSSGARFMQKVSNLTVRSNVPGVSACTASDGGNIEFWPGNYSQANQQNIPNASNQFDFGDATDNKIPGYGCMQVHNWKAKQTVFSINHWGTGGVVDIGIGNAPSSHTDWTFIKNASDYTVRRLTVMVK